jgi:predicted phage-related endonuclease
MPKQIDITHGLPFTRLGKDLLVIPVDGLDRQTWLRYRMPFLGGSDHGTILGLNKRYTRIELFYQKLGLNFSAEDHVNEPMLWGTVHEKNVISMGQYLDMQSGEYMENYLAGRKLRVNTEFRYMVLNPDYPWMLANIDAIEGFNGDPGKPYADAVGEGKTISRQSAEMWSGGLPPYYLAQGMSYSTVLEPILLEDRVNMYVLQDGNKFYGMEVKPAELPALQGLKDRMLRDSLDFYQRLIRGREIMANYQGDRMMHMLEEVEPEPDISFAYEAFYSDFYVKKMEMLKHRRAGTYSDLTMAKEYIDACSTVKVAEREKLKLAIAIKHRLKQLNSNIIYFDDGSKISYNKRLYVNIKNYKPLAFEDDEE